jgi:hypothetical protein
MKKTSIFLFAIALAVSLNYDTQAQSKFGIGGQLFSPTGISVKTDFNEKLALTGVTSFTFSDFNNSIILQANLIFKKQKPEYNIESGKLYLYYGGGIQAEFYENITNRFWLRAPIGIEYEIAETPLGIYLDVAPSLMVEPNMIFTLYSSMGVRLYF